MKAGILSWCRTEPDHLRSAVLMTALVASSAWLRWPGLAPSSLWLDDAWTVAGARAESLEELISTLFTTPGFSVASAALFRVSGGASVGAQLLPFLAGVAAAPAIYLIGRRLGAHWTAATLGAAVAVVSPEHVVYSTRVKVYTLEVLLGLVFLVLLVRALDRPPMLWAATLVGLIATLVSATMAILVLGALGPIALVLWRRDRVASMRWASAAIAFASLSGVWWSTYLKQTVPAKTYRFWDEQYVNVTGTPWHALRTVWSTLNDAAQSLLPLGPFALGVIGVFVVLAWKRNPPVGWMLIGPWAAALLLSVVQRYPLGAGRTDVFLLPAAVLAVVLGVAQLRRLQDTGWMAVALAVVLVVPNMTVRRDTYPREDIRGLVALVESRRSDQQLLVVFPATVWAYALYASTDVEIGPSEEHPPGFEIRSLEPTVIFLAGDSDIATQLDSILEDRSGAWVIASHLDERLSEVSAWPIANDYDSTTWSAPGAVLYYWHAG